MFCCSKLMNRRAKHNEAYVPTTCEHIANISTHGLAIIPSVVAVQWLLDVAHDSSQYLIALVYGCAILCLFIMSTVYHSVFFWGKLEMLRFYLHIIDRGTIYIFIAASYTPWLMLKESGWLGTHMRWLVWLLAVFGIWYQYSYHEKFKLIEISLYIFTSTFPAISVLSMHEWTGLDVLALGGIAYFVGVIFFKCDGVIPCAHAIWHLHVVIGAACQFYAVHTHLMGPKLNKTGQAILDLTDAGSNILTTLDEL